MNKDFLFFRSKRFIIIIRNCNVSSCLVAVLYLTATAKAVAETNLENIIVAASKRGAVSPRETLGGIRAISSEFRE